MPTPAKIYKKKTNVKCHNFRARHIIWGLSLFYYWPPQPEEIISALIKLLWLTCHLKVVKAKRLSSELEMFYRRVL